MNEFVEWPSPRQHRVWVDEQGVAWRRRNADVPDKLLRRLMADERTKVIHAYDVLTQVAPEERDDLLARVLRIRAGAVEGYTDFDVTAFRDDDRRWLLVITESC